MQFTLKARHLSLTDALKDYAKKKLARLENHFDHLLSADVICFTERNFHVVEVTVHANGVTLHAEEKTENMYSSIDKVVDKLERQIQKHKEKLHNHHRPHEQNGSPLNGSPFIEEEGSVRITSKRQKISSFTPEEAAAEMEGRGYTFYLFRNKETLDVNLIYRRENGNLTLLEPVLS